MLDRIGIWFLWSWKTGEPGEKPSKPTIHSTHRVGITNQGYERSHQYPIHAPTKITDKILLEVYF